MTEPELIIDSDGMKRWFLNGKLHRLDGPAVIWPNGDKWWYSNGMIHREDGPAVEWTSGAKWWYFNGQLMSFNEWCQQLNINDEQKVQLLLEYYS